MKKKIRILLFGILCIALLALSVTAVETAYEVRVIAAPEGDYATLADIPTEVGADMLFCGWFTDRAAAASLNLQAAATTPGEAAYGAILQLPSDGALRLVGAQMYVKAPYGVRFVTEIDRALLRTLEALHEKNRAGKDGTLTPRTEHETGIGYGTVLALDVGIDTPQEKRSGASAVGGVTVPGVYTYEENDSALRYTATVLKIAVESITDKIAARPYVTYADANGTERTFYYTEAGRANASYAVSLYQLLDAIDADAVASASEKAAVAAVRASYASTAVEVTPISALNTDTEEDSADFANAYLEADYTTMTFLSSQNGAHYRYTKDSNYSRIIKIKDDLYLMLFQYSKNGIHLYYATSADGLHWSDTPGILYKANDHKYTYTDGPLEGETDTYFAVNADAVVLENGTVLIVYSRRLCKGYSYPEYIGKCSLELIRCMVNDDNTLTFGNPMTIYHGTSWEPEILQRANGRIEIYWSHGAPMVDMYGYFTDAYVYDGVTVDKGGKRSSGVGMICSTDGGYTWTPSTATMDANHYAAKRVYQQFACTVPIGDDMVNFYSGQMPAVVEMTDGRLFLAVEFEPGKQDGMEISCALSDTDGEWKELETDEAGPSARYESLFKGAGPSLCRFPSGEILLSYNAAGKMYTRLLKKDARDVADMKAVYAMDPFGTDVTVTKGYWSTVATKDSHTAILSMAYPKYENYGDGSEDTENDNSAIGIIFGRLNHTTHALHRNIVADGNSQEWAAQTDALFVGSESAAQATYRFAYDAEYIYVCIDYLYADRADGDSLFVSFETAEGKTVTARISGAGNVTDAAGITGGAVLTANGGVYELALDRALLGLISGSVRVSPGFTTGGLTDTIDGTTLDPSTWLTVCLETSPALAAGDTASFLFSIAEMNTNGKNGDHAADDYNTASIENDFRSRADLTYAAQTAQNQHYRYQNAWYPRVKQVRENLYLLTYHYGELGLHMYYATSRDGINWNSPQVLYDASAYPVDYTDTVFANKNEKYAAVNPETVVLQNGEILCVFARRAPSGYKTLADYCGLYLMRGKVNANDKITWSAPTQIYTGQVWEPGIQQRTDGTVEVYFTQIAPYIDLYGFDDEKRSAGVGMIVSADNGYTWTPDIRVGNTNHYRATTVVQTALGNKVSPDGLSHPYFGAQMPVPVELYNGKTLLAFEIQDLNLKFWGSYATSGENGVWKSLALEEVGPDSMQDSDVYSVGSPYVTRFLSGETLLVYNNGGGLYGRIGSPDGDAFGETAFLALPNAAGVWGSASPVGSHAVLLVNQSVRENPTPDEPKLEKLSELSIIRAYLNHRINAPKMAMQTNCNTKAWDAADNTDALFVGSASQAQLALRVAHDDGYVYFLASVLDYDLESGDAVTLCIAEGDDAWYRLTVDLSGNCTMQKAVSSGTQITYSAEISGAFAYAKRFGTVDDAADTDEGYLISVAVPKSVVGLAGASDFKLRPEVINRDSTGQTTDTLTGVSTTSTIYWPRVMLDP